MDSYPFLNGMFFELLIEYVPFSRPVFRGSLSLFKACYMPIFKGALSFLRLSKGLFKGFLSFLKAV